jgi:acetyl-CoA carboxylase/biotin carboxylase 1
VSWNGNETDVKPGGKFFIPYETYQKGVIDDVDKGIIAATKIGFPVMIKASEGGGGKGIRKSTSVEDFPNLFRQVISRFYWHSVDFELICCFHLQNINN